MEAQPKPKKNQTPDPADQAAVKEAEKKFLQHSSIQILLTLIRKISYLVGVYNSFVNCFMKMVDKSLLGNFVYLHTYENGSKRMKYSVQKSTMGQAQKYSKYVRAQQEWIAAGIVSELNGKLGTVKFFLLRNVPSIKLVMKNFENLGENNKRRSTRAKRFSGGRNAEFELFPSLFVYTKPRNNRVFFFTFRAIDITAFHIYIYVKPIES